MEITIDNYHSDEVNRQYMSVSQYKAWIKCEHSAYAQYVTSEYKRKPGKELLVGTAVHALCDGTFEKFKADNPEIISTRGPSKGELKSEYVYANVMYRTLMDDPLCKEYLTGEHEKTFTAELFGIPWKCRIDVHNPEEGFFTDLKTCEDLHKDKKRVDAGDEDGLWMWLKFIEFYNYYLQFAVYAEIERLATGRDKWLKGRMVAVTKQVPPDKECITMVNDIRWHDELKEIETRLPRIIELKKGSIEPYRCNRCEWCRGTKVCKELILPEDL